MNNSFKISVNSSLSFCQGFFPPPLGEHFWPKIFPLECPHSLTLPRVGFFGSSQRWGGVNLTPPLIWPRRGQIFKNVNIILLYNVINRFRPKKSGKSNLRPLYSTFLLFRDLYGKICRFWRHFWRPQKWSEKRCLGGFFAANVLIGVQRTL